MARTVYESIDGRLCGVLAGSWLNHSRKARRSKDLRTLVHIIDRCVSSDASNIARKSENIIPK